MKSKLHLAVGKAIAESIFAAYKVKEEVLVTDINPNFYNRKARFDWVIFGPDIVIEAHGRQHYSAQGFGMESGESVAAFETRKHNDFIKKQAALDVGFTYIEVPYTDIKILNGSYLAKRYKENYNDTVAEKKEKPKQDYKKRYMAYKETKVYREKIQRMREWSKSRYAFLKERRE